MWEPRSYQRGFCAALGKKGLGRKRLVWVMHRRGGKDLTALHATARCMWNRVGPYWHVYPTAEQGKRAIWEGFTADGQRIMEQVFPREWRRSPAEFRPSGEMVVELKNGSIWRLLGSDRIEVVGAGPVGVVFSEFALAKPRAWDLIAPMLDENGGWAAFISTPRGNNHLKKLYDLAENTKGWWRQLLTVHDTGGFEGMGPKAILDGARARGMPEALVRQEYLCDWTAALVGSVWGDLVEKLESGGAVGAFDHPRDGLHVSFDLGISDSTAMWWWRLNGSGGIDFVDHYEAHGKPMSHYFDVLDERDYGYARFWLPHDARARTLTTGESIEDLFREQCVLGRWGAAGMAIGPRLSLLDGIQAARWLLQRPVRIHARCADGIEALRQYHYEYDEDRKRFSQKPAHDWSSHSADAFRYAALVVRATQLLGREEEKPKSPKAKAPTEFTMDEVWDIHEAGRSGRERI